MLINVSQGSKMLSNWILFNTTIFQELEPRANLSKGDITARTVRTVINPRLIFTPETVYLEQIFLFVYNQGETDCKVCIEYTDVLFFNRSREFRSLIINPRHFDIYIPNEESSKSEILVLIFDLRVNFDFKCMRRNNSN